METLQHLLSFIIHLNIHIIDLVNYFGAWSYFILAMVIFAETGLVVMPFLPGDSLLFAAGSVSAISKSTLNINILAMVLILAAILGNTTNYLIGRWFGDRFFTENAKFLKTSHLKKANSFYEKYGAFAVILSRFLPFFRTFIPFVAGLSKMDFKFFTVCNILGACLWVCIFTYTGYFFGNLDWVKNNFGLVILAIIIISILPAIISFIKAKYFSK